MNKINLSLIAIILLSFYSHLAKCIIPQDTLIKRYIITSEKYLETYPDSSLIFAEKAMNLAKKANNPENISDASRSLGKYYAATEDFGKATQYFLDALKFSEKKNDTKRIMHKPLFRS